MGKREALVQDNGKRTEGKNSGTKSQMGGFGTDKTDSKGVYSKSKQLDTSHNAHLRRSNRNSRLTMKVSGSGLNNSSNANSSLLQKRLKSLKGKENG